MTTKKKLLVAGLMVVTIGSMVGIRIGFPQPRSD